MVEGAYDRFDVPGGVHLAWLKDKEVGVVELFHGPTWAFKDYSLIFIGGLLELVLKRRRERRTLLVGSDLFI